MEGSSFDFASNYQQLPRAYHAALARGDIRSSNLDFKVEEVLTFEPCGEGEHLFLQLEKDGCNTDWVIKQIQKVFELSSREVGYAGKKDRHSISTQWFSLHLPGKEIQPEQIESQSIKLKQAIRHNKKLRVGSVKTNRFEIVVRNLSAPIDRKAYEKVCREGFPNYFGNQRFGREFGNLMKAQELLINGKKIKNRNLKGLVLSSARSFLFNLQLAKRVESETWSQILSGDCINLNATQSYYHLDDRSEEEQLRVANGDTHICGWLAGKQNSEATAEALQSELSATQQFQSWSLALKRFNLDSQRRPYRAFANELELVEDGDTAKFSFSLARGCFATALLRELVECCDRSNCNASQSREQDSQ